MSSFTNGDDKRSHRGYFFSSCGNERLQCHDWWETLFHTCENTRKIATFQSDEYATSCLLDYPDFKGNCKLFAIDSGKPQTHDPDTKSVLKTGFIENLDQTGNTALLSFLKKERKVL